MTKEIFNKDPELAKFLGERKSQVSPHELPDKLAADFPRDEYPLPWVIGRERGNGHLDVIAANGAYVAHVYCWDHSDWELLDKKLASINEELVG